MRLFNPFVVLTALLFSTIGVIAWADSSSTGIQQPYLNITGPNQLDAVTIGSVTPAPGTFSSMTVTGNTTLNSSVTFASSTTFNNATTFNSTATFNSGVINNSVITNNGAVTNNATNTFNSGAQFNSAATFTSQIVANGSIDSHGIVFGNALTQNPLVQAHFQSFLTASANAGVVLLASSTGRTIYPGGGITIYASGTGSGSAASVDLECVPSNTIIASWLPTNLLTNVPVGVFSSSGIAGTSLVKGCAASDAVLLSDNGTLLSTSQLFVNFPYTVQ